MSPTDPSSGPSSTALEPWQPPTPPSAQHGAFTRVWIAARPALFPLAVGAIAWTLSDHGGAHSTGDAAIGTALAIAAGTVGHTLSAAAKRQHQHPTGVGELEPHAAMLTSRGGLVCWALSGLAALATIDTYTSNPYLRALYTALGMGVPVFFQRLTTRHHDDAHLAFAQKLALEQTVTGATIKVEQLRQDGQSTRTAVEQEQGTVRTRLEQDGKTERTGLRENGATARALVEAYTTIATSPVARSAPTGAASVSPGPLQGLLSLSSTAAAALEPGTLERLGHAAGQAPAETDSKGQYL